MKEFLSELSLNPVRKESFRGTLWDKLKHFGKEERLGRLLGGARCSEFLQALRHNFAIAQSDFRLDRRLEAARKEQSEIGDQISKIFGWFKDVCLGGSRKSFACCEVSES